MRWLFGMSERSLVQPYVHSFTVMASNLMTRLRPVVYRVKAKLYPYAQGHPYPWVGHLLFLPQSNL